MAKKLYEEADIQDIAIAIREKNGSTTKYKTKQMGDAIRAISSGGGENSCSHTAKQYTGTINDTTDGSGAYAVLVTDSWLAEHRSDPDLLIMVKFDIAPTVYSIVECFGCADVNNSALSQCQLTRRWGSTANMGKGTVSYEVDDDTNISAGVGRIFISTNGELCVYANSSNYAIRPCDFAVTITGYLE